MSKTIVRPLTSILLSFALLIMVLPRTSSAIHLKRRTLNGASSSKATQQRATSRRGELLVRFRGDVSRQAQDILLAAHGARRQRELRGESRVEKVELPAEQDVFTAAAQIRLNPQVEVAEPKVRFLAASYAKVTIIIADHVADRNGGTAPYGDYREDQALIQRGIAYFNAGCHKK